MFQGGNLAVSVCFVSGLDVGQDALECETFAGNADLFGAAFGTDFRFGCQKNFEFGLGEDDRSGVPSVGNQSFFGQKIALALQQCGADFGPLRNCGCAHTDGFCPDAV
nr:Uncharacterised protein [Neisseria gonorrhoeae]